MNKGQRELFHASLRCSGNVLVIECHGPIVFRDEACQFRNLIMDALAHHTTVVLDLSQVRIIDAYGLGTLIDIYLHAASSDKKVYLCGTSTFVNYVLELTKLDQLFVSTQEIAYLASIPEQVA